MKWDSCGNVQTGKPAFSEFEYMDSSREQLAQEECMWMFHNQKQNYGTEQLGDKQKMN